MLKMQYYSIIVVAAELAGNNIICLFIGCTDKLYVITRGTRLNRWYTNLPVAAAEKNKVDGIFR